MPSSLSRHVVATCLECCSHLRCWCACCARISMSIEPPVFFSFSTTLRDQLVFTTFESNANCKQSVEAKLNGCWWRADAVCGCMRNMFVFRFALPIFYRGFQRDNDALRFAELKCWTANGERGIILIWCACEWVREWRTVPFDKHTTIAFWVRSNRWP